MAISPHFDFFIYLVTDYGNLYIIYLDISTLKIIKAERHFLGHLSAFD
jgi:hypothetical protein